MAGENEFMFHAFLTGIYITFVYDLLRILRRVIPHRDAVVSLEDLIFWIYCAAKVFLLMYYESNGTLRWFAVLGAVTGMFLYSKLVSPLLVSVVSDFLRRLMNVLGKAIGFLFWPFKAFMRKIRRKIKETARKRAVKMLKKKEIGVSFLKKQLTVLRKVHKMDT